MLPEELATELSLLPAHRHDTASDDSHESVVDCPVSIVLSPLVTYMVTLGTGHDESGGVVAEHDPSAWMTPAFVCPHAFADETQESAALEPHAGKTSPAPSRSDHARVLADVLVSSPPLATLPAAMSSTKIPTPMGT